MCTARLWRNIGHVHVCISFRETISLTKFPKYRGISTASSQLRELPHIQEDILLHLGEHWEQHSSISNKMARQIWVENTADWTTLNRLRTGVGRFRASMKMWRLTDSAAFESGEPEQTADHIINSCPLHRPPSEAGLFEVGPLTRAWLQHTELTIWDDDLRKKKKKQ